jgi:outer membrane protein OmpA-like peptidoglycan-associated protein
MTVRTVFLCAVGISAISLSPRGAEANQQNKGSANTARVRELTDEEKKQLSTTGKGPNVLLIDKAQYGLTLLTPNDGTMYNKIWITAPGKPLEGGLIELTVMEALSNSEEGRPVFQKVFEYDTVEETAELVVELPETLPKGRYTVESRLFLYGNIPGVEPGKVHSIRRQQFVRGKLQERRVQERTFVVADYQIGKRTLSPRQVKAWKQNLKGVERVKIERIVIEGYTCDIGTPFANQSISLARAEHVADLLLKMGITEEKIVIIAKGDREPLHTNDTELNRRKNRRVEVRVYFNR